jgi:long-chain-fatty-acid--CoA ligase ACSBG
MSYTCTDPREDVAIRMGEGVAARPPTTLVAELTNTCAAFPGKVTMRVKRNGAWKTWTFSEYLAEVHTVAKSLLKLGVKEREAVAIIGFNSPEWVFTWTAAVFVGCMGTGIYATNGPEGVAYVVEHSKATVLVAEDEKQLAKFRGLSGRCASVKAYVAYAPGVKPEPVGATPTYAWADFLTLGAGVADDEVKGRSESVVPGQCCSLIYTSGTTGNPKAVMISHDSCTWTAKVAFGDVFAADKHEDKVVSYLPLSHIAGQLMDIVSPIVCGVQVSFAQPDALKGSLKDTLQDVQPTVFFGVPRVWEKFREAMKAKAAAPGTPKAYLVQFVKDAGLAKYLAAEKGAPDPNNCMTTMLCGALTGKIKGVLGLDKCRVFVTGAAPISTDLLEYFGQIDINVLELFGMSEVTGPSNMSTASDFRIGKCGLQIPGTVTKCDPATGEVIFTGRHLMMGYMYNPEATAKTIDADGWLHSGDVGTVDEDGYLKITGRIKEILITAAGENVAPVLLEDEIKRRLPMVSNAMVVGDKKKFLTVLLTLKTKMHEDGAPMDVLLKDAALHDCSTVAEAQRSSAYADALDAGLKAANKNAISRAQNVQKWAILPEDFTQDGGELTPTMKLKRKVVLEKYAAVVDGLYN